MRWFVDPLTPPRAASASTLLRLATRDLVTFLLSVRGRYEAGLVFVILLILEWIIPGPASLARIAPHPFWIPVILISVQYGSASGILVAAFAAGLSWVVGWPPQSGAEDYFAYSLRVWREPVLWMIGALVVGGLRNREIKDRQSMQGRLILAETQRDTIGSYALDLQEELTRCERRAATTEISSVEAAVETLSTLRGGGAPEPLPLLRTAIESWMGPTTWTFYRIDGGEVVPSLSARDAAAAEPLTAAMAFRIGSVHTVAHRQMAVLSVFDGSQAALLDGVGVYACSVPRAWRGGSHGLLVIETLPTHRLRDATAEAVAMIAGALGERLDRYAPEVAIVRHTCEIRACEIRDLAAASVALLRSAPPSHAGHAP